MRSRIYPALSILLLLASCSSLPAQGKAPDWTINFPKPDARNTYFVGYASDPKGDTAKATNDAAANLIADIMKYIGVKISVDSTATAKATLDKYSADIKSTVTAQATNQIAGFAIKDKYVYTDPKTKNVIVYVLASYITADLEKEKRRIEEAMIEKVDAVAKPEREGRALADEGRHFEAVKKFIEAAVAASGSDIDNAEIKMERNVNSARTALAKLRFDRPSNEVIKALVGQNFPQPFKVRVVSGEGTAAPGVPAANLLVSYSRKQGTRLVSKTDNAVTDQNGLLSYSPPAPDFVGKAKLLVRLDFASSMELLDRLPAKYGAYRASLAEELKGKFIEMPYEVASNAKNVPMSVAIVDLDENGAPVAGAQTQAGLLDALVKEKFKVRGLPLDPALLAQMDDEAIAAAAKAVAGVADRVAYGSSRISTVTKDGTTYLATAKAAVKVIELSTGSILYSSEKSSTMLGSDEQSARRAAYRDLGLNALGKEMLSSLP